MSEQNIYPAKLLLFGEHTVLKGSSSLAIPFDKYGMFWQQVEDTHDQEHQTWLNEYTAYLKAHCSSFLDIDQLEEHLRNHTIVADIPIGYGLGSSGALTAAIYAVSSIEEPLSLDIRKLQEQLGLMESFFHGKSSGFDPLVSHFKKSLKKTKDKIEIIDKSRMSIPAHCYLLDSGQPRSGKDMIENFLTNWTDCEDEMSTLCQANDEAIDNILGVEVRPLYEIVKEISSIQLECMDYMIVQQMMDLWKAGLASDEYYLKVCGAGGGGYYLAFSQKELDHIGPFQLEKVTI